MERILRAGVEAGEAAVAAICKGDLLLDGDVSGGADLGAGAAEDALAGDDMRLIAGKANGLHRTVADALIAVFAVGFPERQAVRHVDPSL